jgi:hypothetical protein
MKYVPIIVSVTVNILLNPEKEYAKDVTLLFYSTSNYGM